MHRHPRPAHHPDRPPRRPPIRGHARRLIAESLRLGKLPELDNLRLGAWAHMLGFHGHFSTKSRTYSTTLGQLRAARADYQHQHALACGYLPATADGVLVVGTWHFSGSGHARGDWLPAVIAVTSPTTSPANGR